MYIPNEFEIKDKNEIKSFIKENSFGMIISYSDDGFQVTHVPLLLEEEGETLYLYGHFAIGNGHWKLANGRRVLAIFNGPHYYMSPRWYKANEAVPTWNYMTVHCEGQFSTIDNVKNVEILKKMLEYYEIDRELKNKMEEPYYSKMSKGVKSFSIKIDKIYAKYKLSQNRTHDDRLYIVENLRKINTQDSLRMAEEIIRFNNDMKGDGTVKPPLKE